MTGEVGILNVGAGDTKLVFDKNNPQDMIRAKRIVTDMLRRGYALLVEVEPGKMQRATAFDEEKGEYIIADFDPLVAQEEDAREEEAEETVTADTAGGATERPKGRRGRPPGSGKRVPATETRAVAVGRTAGG